MKSWPKCTPIYLTEEQNNAALLLDKGKVISSYKAVSGSIYMETENGGDYRYLWDNNGWKPVIR